MQGPVSSLGYRRIGVGDEAREVIAVSEQMYRDKVVRLTKDKAGLEKRAATEADKLAKLDAEMAGSREALLH